MDAVQTADRMRTCVLKVRPSGVFLLCSIKGADPNLKPNLCFVTVCSHARIKSGCANNPGIMSRKKKN